MPHIQPILSAARGKVSVDIRNNQIIITDTAVKIQQAREIVQIIDKVTPQVIIEARIVEANSAFTRDLGFDWGTVSAGPFDIGDAALTLTGLASNLPATIPSAVVGGTFQKLTGTPFEIIDAKLVASESEGKTNIISAPKVVTLNNKKARIKQGLEVPYLERDSSGNATVRFKNVDLLLEVTPHITPDDRIVMKIFVTKNDVVDPTADQPALSTNEAETELLIDDGDTVVIGGIVKSTIQYGEKGIPGLRQLGVLGWLFKSQAKKDQKNELLIFITPRIVKLEQKKMKILSRPIVSKGRFFYRAPGDLRWEYDSPIRSVLLLNEGNVERFTWRDGKYSRDAGGSLEGLRFVLQDISGWLAGDFVSSTTFTAELKHGSPDRIVLSPRDESFTKFIQRVELTLAPTPGVLRSVEIVESQENSTYIEFQNVETNLPFGEGLFTGVQ